MTTVRVFINARGYDVPSDASTIAAVRIADPLEADAVAAGSRIITDSRGLPVATNAPVHGGVIYRLITNRGQPLDVDPGDGG
jgi:hypothetical protein